MIRDATTGAEIWRRDAAQSGGQQIWRALGCEADGDAPMTPTLALDFDLDKAAALDIDDGLDALHVDEETTAVDCVFAAPLDIDEDDERLLRLLLIKITAITAQRQQGRPRALALREAESNAVCVKGVRGDRRVPVVPRRRFTKTPRDARLGALLRRARDGGVRRAAAGGWRMRSCIIALRGPARRRDDGGLRRECANRVRPAELELETVITSFAERFDTWLAAARRASIESAENDDAALVAWCDEWRSVLRRRLL